MFLSALNSFWCRRFFEILGCNDFHFSKNDAATSKRRVLRTPPLSLWERKSVASFYLLTDRKSTNLIKNKRDFASKKLLLQDPHERVWNLDDNLDAILMNLCFHEIQHIKNIKISGFGLLSENTSDCRIDFCMSSICISFERACCEFLHSCMRVMHWKIIASSTLITQKLMRFVETEQLDVTVACSC